MVAIRARYRPLRNGQGSAKSDRLGMFVGADKNNTIRNLTGEYKKIEPDCREGVRAQLERMKELCKERNNLYEKQNDLKGQKQKIEKSLER